MHAVLLFPALTVAVSAAIVEMVRTILQRAGNFVLRAEVIVEPEAQQVIFVSDARDEDSARAIVEDLRIQRLIEKQILGAGRPLRGEGVFESGADRVFHSRGSRPGGAEDLARAARAKRQSRRPARAAGRDAAGQIEEGALIRDPDAAANACKEIRA